MTRLLPGASLLIPLLASGEDPAPARPDTATLASPSAPARGPLRVHPDNPRYFTDGSGKAVYLTGSHNWYDLQDAGRIDGSSKTTFDFEGYLRFLESHGHNCIRLWAWEGAGCWWQGGAKKEYYTPLPYRRTGPGNAADGKPRFDLERFDAEYFDRLRSRVTAARDRGIYVVLMLFQGWSIYDHGYGNPWPLHPYHAANNANGIDGDADGDGDGKDVHSLRVPAVTRLQEAYIRKVIDTVNDLDNVLYEVTNETAIHSRDWQYHVVRFVKEYESTKPRRHPVGMTYFDSGPRGTMEALLESPADWISPGDDGGRYDFQNDPPPADGKRVSLADTDHIFGVGGDGAWVWKTFLRGHHPIYMDPLRDREGFRITEADLEDARRAMGQTRRFAERIRLAALAPRGDLASTGYCLADPGSEYLVHVPGGKVVSVDLTAAGGELEVEWFDPRRDQTTRAAAVTGGARREWKAPFDGPAVLHLKAKVPRRGAVAPAGATGSRVERRMEALGRGVVAIHRAPGEVFVGWRLLGTDPEDIAFNVYRTPPGSASRPVRLNDEPIARVTWIIDRAAGVAWQNVGYNQPPHPGFFLGHGMGRPPRPAIVTRPGATRPVQ